MMREVVVNGRFLSRPITGVERYGRGMLSVMENRLRVETTQANGISGHAWEQFVLPTKLSSKSILWSPANTGPISVRNQALTIHDLSPLEHPEWFRANFAAWYRLFLPVLAKRVRLIFTPSEYMKNKIMKRFDVNHVIVTPNGVDTSIFHPGAKQTAHAIGGKYILFVGSLQPRKNLSALIAAWRDIKDEFKEFRLIVGGESGHVFRRQKFSDEEGTCFLNYVHDHDLPGLYAGAELLVLPSLGEGFGLPALEAMACGTPVLVSNGGALPEIVGDAAMIFDVAKPDDLKKALKGCLQDHALRRSLKEKGPIRAKAFSWQRTADLIWNKLNDN